MVGSGFSRCASKLRPSASDPPLMQDLEIEMDRRLYPSEGGTGSSQRTNDGSGAYEILSLSQEYSTAFGRNHLHSFLEQQIGDNDFAPGDLHARLLELPWRDIFTTNWDTLLERARSKVTDRAYDLVVNMEQIPLARSPRIVKLHGSLPAQFPLIFTEEDYRTYPNLFAPFVNTVQQAMMETVFCLIGFSGNDLNFLHWSGWVRDNLGVSAPKIYLAGWLNLSPHKRRMLENRGVVPIDLAQHLQASNWPEHMRHRYAIEWVLAQLALGRPYDIRDWPSLSGQPMLEIADHLQPVSGVRVHSPLEEPSAGTSIPASDRVDRVKKVIDVWRHNRLIYPGWIVFPSGQERHTLIRDTDFWEPHILAALTELEPLDRIYALREVLWRRDILLQPMSQSLESQASDALEAVDCERRTIDGHELVNVDWGEARQAWRYIAMQLVTAARIRLDAGTFGRRIPIIERFASEDRDVFHTIWHERCLWALYSRDLRELEASIAKWELEDSDPIWMIRKSALLRELDLHEEAAELTRSAVSEIRRIEDGDSSVAGVSRESWALWSEIRLDNFQALLKRWQELAHMKCDAFLEKDAVARGLDIPEDSSESPSFDLGHREVLRFQFNQASTAEAVYRAAVRVLRLSEVAGLPLQVRVLGNIGSEIATQNLKAASENLANLHLELAIRIVLRVCTNDRDPVLSRVLSRQRVATLVGEVAVGLATS